MFHPTLAPDLTNKATIAATVIRTVVQPNGEQYGSGPGIEVISVELPGKPTMLIAEDGTARLVRPRARQAFNGKMVYASKKVFTIATPFTQPLSVILAAYESAIAGKVEDWKTVPDENVRHIWANPDGSDETTISPDWYADNGTPVCGDDSDFDGDDMIYVRTEVKS